MSYGKPLEELLTSTRKLPAELSLNEVEFLFLNPTPPPPAPPWWQRGSYLKFLLMFTLLISLLSFLLLTSNESMDYQLSAFPVHEKAPETTAVALLSGPQGITTLGQPTINYATPEVSPPALQPAPAPAAAPETQEDKPSEILMLDDEGNLSYGQRARVQLPKALFAGGYSYVKDNLMLTFKEAEEEPVNLLFLNLSPAEQRALKNAEASPFVIQRAAGSLLLYLDGTSGSFDFLPNKAFREELNDRGWGDASLPQDSAFIRITMGKIEDTGSGSALMPRGQVWFRYFAIDVNEEYLKLLRQAGYTNEELNDLWRLPNSLLQYDRLEEILQLSAAVLTNKPPLSELPSLKYEIKELTKLKRQGVRMSFEEFKGRQSLPELLRALTGTPKDSTTVTNFFEQALDRYWSLEMPGTVSDTIAYSPEKELELIGNFKYRLSEDPNRDYILVFGPKRVIRKMKRKSDYKAAELVNARKRKTIYVEIPQTVKLIAKPSQKITVKANFKPKE